MLARARKFRHYYMEFAFLRMETKLKGKTIHKIIKFSKNIYLEYIFFLIFFLCSKSIFVAYSKVSTKNVRLAFREEAPSSDCQE